MKLQDFVPTDGLIVFATQEPYGSYHLKEISLTVPNIIHLQPMPAIASHGITATDDPSIIDKASMLIITGGLMTSENTQYAQRARSSGVPIIFLELAYAQDRQGTVSCVLPDMILSTTAGGQTAYRTYFGEKAHIRHITHPALEDLPAVNPESKTILIGTSVSSEYRDNCENLRNLAHLLSSWGKWNVKVRLHPRENPELWKEFDITHGTVLSEDLSQSKVFISYQTTAFLTANAMSIPCMHLATEPWMEHLTPPGFAESSALCHIENLYQVISLLMDMENITP